MFSFLHKSHKQGLIELAVESISQRYPIEGGDTLSYESSACGVELGGYMWYRFEEASNALKSVLSCYFGDGGCCTAPTGGILSCFSELGPAASIS